MLFIDRPDHSVSLISFSMDEYKYIMCVIVDEIEFGFCLLRDKKGFDMCLYKYKVSW